MITQKAEYTRFASQINQIVTIHKDINAQLIVLNNRFEEFQKNVGLWCLFVYKVTMHEDKKISRGLAVDQSSRIEARHPLMNN